MYRKAMRISPVASILCDITQNLAPVHRDQRGVNVSKVSLAGFRKAHMRAFIYSSCYV